MNNNSQYIKFFRKLAILVLILFAGDRLTGYILQQQYYKQTHGDAHTGIYLLEQAKEDIIIMGGSRASHHYNSEILEKETGMSAFNGGRDEMVISYISAILDILYKRHKPKVLILDITPHEISKSNNIAVINQRVSTNLLPFLYKHPELAETIHISGNNELLKSKISTIYPYNSLIGTIIQNTYTGLGHKTIKGYEPLYGHLDTTNYKVSLFGADYPQQFPVYDKYESKLLETISSAKGNNIKVMVVISPFYFPLNKPGEVEGYRRMIQIFAENNVSFHDFSSREPYFQNPLLFKDDIHLNDSAAAIFSKEIADIIKNQP